VGVEIEGGWTMGTNHSCTGELSSSVPQPSEVTIVYSQYYIFYEELGKRSWKSPNIGNVTRRKMLITLI
jgi:hypothetical protein